MISNCKREERGAVAILFGLMSVTLLLAGGVAIDFARIVDMRERVMGAVDSASLAAGRAMLESKLSDAEVKRLATAYFNENVAKVRSMGTVATPVISLDRATGTVTINVQANVSMTFSRVGGFTEMAVPVASTAVYRQSDVEIGMALDITGSMNDRVNGTRKIDALKSAFAIFADRVFHERPDAVHKVRIGLAPYSAGINLGDIAGAASAYRSKDGCVTERKSGAFSDRADPFFVMADGTKNMDPTGGGAGYLCPAAKVTPLSDDKDALIRTVASYQLSSSTGGHFGVQWAWNLVSDRWAGIWGRDAAPESYDRVKDGKLLKAVVLMTDGMFNTAFHAGKSSAQTVELCTAMKKKGVVVFTVGFGLSGSDRNAITMLQSCATPGEGYFADASNAGELNAAFAHFAAKLSELRIAR